MTRQLLRVARLIRGSGYTSAVAIAAALVVGTPAMTARAQFGVTLNGGERGAALLGSTLAGIGTTGRVLTIAAHPDDEDTPVIAWLARASCGDGVSVAHPR